MQPTITARNAEYYRQRASQMRRAAMQSKSDDLFRLYNRAAKSWEELAEMAEKSVARESIAIRS